MVFSRAGCGPARGLVSCFALAPAPTRSFRVKPATIAVLLTCHNRRQHTLACLEGIHRNTVDGVTVDIHLVDDGSSDGTAEAVAEAYPDVEITTRLGRIVLGRGHAACLHPSCAGASRLSAVAQ